MAVCYNMIIDLNDNKYLDKLREAANTEQGRMILDFIAFKKKDYDFKDIADTTNFAELGMVYKVCKEVNLFIDNIIKFLE